MYLNIRFFQGWTNQTREYKYNTCGTDCFSKSPKNLVFDNEFEVINLDTPESKVIRLLFYKYENGYKVFDFLITLDTNDKHNSKIAFCKSPPIKPTDACETEDLTVRTEILFEDFVSTYFGDKEHDKKVSRGLRANAYKIRDRRQGK